MNAKKIVYSLETYKDIEPVIDIYMDLEDDEVQEIIAYLHERTEGNKNVIKKQTGNDKLGTAGTVALTAGGGAAGVAGVVASGIGGTILGSSTLGSLLGGFLVVSNPIGWVIGGGAAAAAAAYGVSKMVKSGGKNDKTREDNIVAAKTGEKYNSVRVINEELFLNRNKVADILSNNKKIKTINKNGGRRSALDIEDMFDGTTLEKINIAHNRVSQELSSEISQYVEVHKNDIDAFALFIEKCTKRDIVGFKDSMELLQKVKNCDILIGEFKEFESNLRQQILLNSQVLIYKLAILADGVASKEEMDWYFANMKTKGIESQDAEILFKQCPVENINIKETFAAVEDFFGSDFKTLLVSDISAIISVDGVDRKEYIFLKEMCNQLGMSENYTLKQYEKDHKFSMALDRVKSWFS